MFGSQVSIALTQHVNIAPRLPLSDEPQLHTLHFDFLSVKACKTARQTGIPQAKHCENTPGISHMLCSTQQAAIILGM